MDQKLLYIFAASQKKLVAGLSLQLLLSRDSYAESLVYPFLIESKEKRGIADAL